MKKGLFKTLCIVLLLEVVIGSLNLAQAEEKSSSRRQRALRWEKTWLNPPHRRHTDSSTTAQRQAEFQERTSRWEDTWLNAPRRRHTDTSTTASRQANFKKRCVAWEKTWFNAPRRRHTDSSPFQTASSAQNVK
ncbi:MAG: hypothetical protein HY590_06940 [Candidatus Omnitrophica bacterium]|nr:hypothetical protein [Candidatus Omnitrophota bacterium]